MTEHNALYDLEIMQKHNDGVFKGLLPVLLNIIERGDSPPALFIFERDDSDKATVLSSIAVCPAIELSPVVVHYAVGLLPEINAVTFFCSALAVRKELDQYQNSDDALRAIKEQYGDIENHPDVEKTYNLFRDNGDKVMMSFCKADDLSPVVSLQHMDTPMEPSETPIGPFGGMMYYGLCLREALERYAAPAKLKQLAISERIALLKAMLKRDSVSLLPADKAAIFTDDAFIDFATNLVANLCDKSSELALSGGYMH